MAEQEQLLEPDIQLMVEIRQSVLSKKMGKPDVERTLEFMREWNRSRPAPDA